MTHPRLQGLRLTLAMAMAMAGSQTPAARRPLDDAAGALRDAGLQVSTEWLAGPAATALPHVLRTRPLSLLVMGACSQPRWREWLRASTTTPSLRTPATCRCWCCAQPWLA